MVTPIHYNGWDTEPATGLADGGMIHMDEKPTRTYENGDIIFPDDLC